MSITTTNMTLTSWTSSSDLFSNTQLDGNWQKIDAHDHSSGKGVKISASGLNTSAVTATQLASNAVTTVKILDANVTAAKLGSNSVLAAAIGTLPGARVFNSANISIPDSTNTTLTFDSERFDTDTIHSTSSNQGRLTATTAGVYIITGHVTWAANATGYREVFIKLNGTTTIAESTHNANVGATTHQSIATIYKLAAADYVELRVNQTSTAALNVTTNGNFSPEFAMMWSSD